MTRVAAIDCGTNSLRLLISDVIDDGLTDVVRTMEIVRLGQGVDRTGRFSDDALQRTFAVLDEYAKVIAAHDVARVRMVATSATRDASNRDEFLDGVRTRLGVEAEVVSGDEEAALSFRGATEELPSGERYTVCDIGGGSTEIIVGDRAVSLDIGCVRMTERHLRADPPTAEQIEAATADIDAALASAPFAEDGSTLVGLAGSVTTVAALVLGLDAYDPVRIHHSRLSAPQVAEVTGRLLRATHAERAAMPPMHPGRVDVIGAGALILDRVMRRGGFGEVVVSEHDILDGIALGLLD